MVCNYLPMSLSTCFWHSTPDFIILSEIALGDVILYGICCRSVCRSQCKYSLNVCFTQKSYTDWLHGIVVDVLTPNKDQCVVAIKEICPQDTLIQVRLIASRRPVSAHDDEEPRFIMMTSSNGNIFRVTVSWGGEFTGHRWVPLTKASDAELWCFLWSAIE